MRTDLNLFSGLLPRTANEFTEELSEETKDLGQARWSGGRVRVRPTKEHGANSRKIFCKMGRGDVLRMGR